MKPQYFSLNQIKISLISMLSIFLVACNSSSSSSTTPPPNSALTVNCATGQLCTPSNVSVVDAKTN